MKESQVVNPNTVEPSPSEDYASGARKMISRRRIFWALVAIDILIGALLVYEIASLFL